MNEDDDISYLDAKPEDLVAMPAQQRVWATISDDLELEYIDWDMINELEKELLDEKSIKTDMIAAEIVLAVVCFCAGCIVGAVYL